jgi:hypothetical protein
MKLDPGSLEYEAGAGAIWSGYLELWVLLSENWLPFLYKGQYECCQEYIRVSCFQRYHPLVVQQWCIHVPDIVLFFFWRVFCKLTSVARGSDWSCGQAGGK